MLSGNSCSSPRSTPPKERRVNGAKSKRPVHGLGVAAHSAAQRRITGRRSAISLLQALLNQKTGTNKNHLTSYREQPASTPKSKHPFLFTKREAFAPGRRWEVCLSGPALSVAFASNACLCHTPGVQHTSSVDGTTQTTRRRAAGLLAVAAVTLLHLQLQLLLVVTANTATADLASLPRGDDLSRAPGSWPAVSLGYRSKRVAFV